MDNLSYDGPIVLAILDGVGLAPDGPGNAVSKAHTPFLGRLSHEYFRTALEASGEAVGLPAGQMGNSEVGHNTMGAGKPIIQGVARINQELDNGGVFNSQTWTDAIENIKKNHSTLHFAGIFSDGGVHSDIKHLFKMIDRAIKDGVTKIRVHAVFDGRDVSPYSSTIYVEKFEEFTTDFPDADIKLASGGGRMVFVADRYENDWQVVARGWDAMVNGHADFYFKSANEAITTLRKLFPDIQDQYLPAFVIEDDFGAPIGRVEKGDSFIYFDFRADRAIEIAEAFTYHDFPYFNRGNYQPDDVYFAGLTEYNSDTHVPEHRLVEPVAFGETLSRFLSDKNISTLAASETVKYGHITYYFNGNSYEKLPNEEYLEINSYTEPFETRPWMKTAELTDAVIKMMPNFKFVRINFPGGDMVGHTADMPATIIAMEAIDLSLKRLADEVDKLGGALIITADHGNAEELLDASSEKKTSHTTNKVPFMIYDNTKNREHYVAANVVRSGLSSVAATIATLLGFDDYPNEWGKSLIRVV